MSLNKFYTILRANNSISLDNALIKIFGESEITGEILVLKKLKKYLFVYLNHLILI